jgi:hypothetical protein
MIRRATQPACPPLRTARGLISAEPCALRRVERGMAPTPSEQSDTKHSATQSVKSLAVAKTLAPEEIRAGDFVAILRVTTQWPSFFWCGGEAPQPVESAIRIPWILNDGGVPLRVVSVCLPFVLAKPPTGPSIILDVRVCQFGKLGVPFAIAARKALKKAAGI